MRQHLVNNVLYPEQGRVGHIGRCHNVQPAGIQVFLIEWVQAESDGWTR